MPAMLLVLGLSQYSLAAGTSRVIDRAYAGLASGQQGAALYGQVIVAVAVPHNATAFI